MVTRTSELPSEVRVLQAGLVVNAFGNGAVAPFLILYLHNARGLSLAVAGAAAAVAAACALLATLISGGVAGRHGPRRTMIAGLCCSTVAYGLYPLVRQPWHALALAALAGVGIGTWLTMQSSVLAAITPSKLRHVAFARQRVAANVGLGLGGFAGGLIVTTARPGTFTTLFWLNAATFVVYMFFVVRVAMPTASAPAGAAERGRYREVLADRVFLRFAVLNFAFVAAAVSLLNALLPVYAKNQTHVSERFIGVLFLFNSLTIIALQLPFARAVEGRRRMHAFAVMGLLFAASWIFVAVAGFGVGGTAMTILVCAVGAFSLAECLFDAVQGPLVSDLARTDLMGRYFAVMGFSWQFGFIVGPAVGALLLAAAPIGLWLAAAAICVGGSAYSLVLDRRLPEHVRRTPRVAVS